MTVLAVSTVAGVILILVILRGGFRGERIPAARPPRNLYIGLSLLTVTLAVVETVSFAVTSQLRALGFSAGAWIATVYFLWSAWRAT
ncbi:MAG: hypothetical protein Q7T33_11180 [Dehalococcoidia bacterium]|nr:hypothetical protein [Dehalococcoidia bacterium]